MGFNDIIGHENIKKEILSCIKEGRFTHSHIFSGDDGTGKSLIARETAKLILNKDFDKAYADFYVYRRQDGKLSLGIKEILGIITEINKKPFEGDKKVILIHEADKMTEEAQNAFLKTIEEPPEGVYIMLLCEDSEKLLRTIKSRCSIHSLGKLDRNDLKLFIKRKYPDITEQEQKKLSFYADGIPGMAEKFMEDDDFKNMRNNILDILMCLNGNNIYKLIDFEKSVSLNKNEHKNFFAIFLSYIRDIIIYKETLKEDMIINFDKSESLKNISLNFSLNKMYKYIELIYESAKLIESNINTGLVLYTMLYKMQEV